MHQIRPARRSMRRQFAESFAESGCAKDAAIEAGYSPDSAHVRGHRLLQRDEVRDTIEAIAGEEIEELQRRARSARMRRFAAEFVAKGGVGSAAAIAAGYAPGSASVAASRLLRREDVRALIADLLDRQVTDPELDEMEFNARERHRERHAAAVESVADYWVMESLPAPEPFAASPGAVLRLKTLEELTPAQVAALHHSSWAADGSLVRIVLKEPGKALCELAGTITAAAAREADKT